MGSTAGLSAGALLSLPVLAAAGCGGSAHAAFVKRADRVCGRAETALQALPRPRTPADEAAQFERRLALARGEVAGLEQLEPPARDRVRRDRLTAAIRAEIEAARYLHTAAVIGDSQTAQAADTLGRRAHARARDAADSLGLHVCGR